MQGALASSIGETILQQGESFFLYDFTQCQQAFLKAYRAIPNFRGDSAFYTWMYRIATNEAITFLNQKAKKNNFIVSTIYADSSWVRPGYKGMLSVVLAIFSAMGKAPIP